MDIQQAIKHFGSQKALAEALSVSPGMVTHLKNGGELPERYQWQIQGLTNGALKVDRKYRKKIA